MENGWTFVITGHVGTVGFDSSSSATRTVLQLLKRPRGRDIPVPDDQHIGIPGSKTKQGRTGARTRGRRDNLPVFPIEVGNKGAWLVAETGRFEVLVQELLSNCT